MVHVTTKSIFTSPEPLRHNRIPSLANQNSDASSTSIQSHVSDYSSRNYIRWDADGVEKVPPGEEEDIKAVANQINKQQQEQFDNHRHVYTGTHSRTHGIVKGTFIVHDNLPEHLRQGELFHKAGEHPAACRYSTEPGAPGFPDNIPAPRGFAMKLFNVHGDFFDAGKDTPTQDIEFNSTPAIELADAKTTREIFDIRMGLGTLRDTPEMNKRLEKRHDTDLQKARFHVPNRPLESLRQYSQTAYRFGDYVMKFCLVPNTQTQISLYDLAIKPDQHDSDVLHRWLSNFHRKYHAEYVFQVQLLENLAEQPVEYAGTAWDEEKYPWQTVATLKVPRQEPFQLERKTFWEDHMRLDPWHGLKAYRPLGGSNRLRRVVYPASSDFRRRMNGREEVVVKDIGQIPG